MITILTSALSIAGMLFFLWIGIQTGKNIQRKEEYNSRRPLEVQHWQALKNIRDELIHNHPSSIFEPFNDILIRIESTFRPVPTIAPQEIVAQLQECYDRMKTTHAEHKDYMVAFKNVIHQLTEERQ